MLHSRQDLAFGRSIALQFISDDDARNILQPFEELAEKAFCCFFVAPTLDQNIQDVAILIHCSPQVVPLPMDGEEDLIQVPFVTTARATTAQFIGVGLPKLETPLPNRFVRDDDPTLRQKLLNITKTEREAKIEPNRMADDFRWKAKAFVRGSDDVCFHKAILTQCSALFPS